jgi:hypothetical protein
LPSIILPDPKITPGALNPKVRQSTIKNSRQFAIVPGHSDSTVEVVIAREKDYHLVRKQFRGRSDCRRD